MAAGTDDCGQRHTGGKISKLTQQDWRAFISLENHVLPSLPLPQYSGQIPKGSLQAATSSST